MRLFLAIEVPESIRIELAALGGALEKELPAARWVHPDRMHLTLEFLGELEDGAIDRLVASVEPVSRRHPVLRLVIAGPGVFPAGRPAKVAWVGLEASTRLDALRDDLRRTLDEILGRAPDPRPYHPHLTLARCKRPWARWAAERWCAARTVCADREFEVTYIDLMQSRLTPSGPDYQRLRRFPLEG